MHQLDIFIKGGTYILKYLNKSASGLKSDALMNPPCSDRSVLKQTVHVDGWMMTDAGVDAEGGVWGPASQRYLTPPLSSLP